MRKTRFNLELKYTSYIDLSSATGDTDYHNDTLYLGLSKSRRQEIRYGIQRGVNTIPHFDVDKFQQLYKTTFERQNIPVEREEIRLITEICSSLYKANQLRMFGTLLIVEPSQVCLLLALTTSERIFCLVRITQSFARA